MYCVLQMCTVVSTLIQAREPVYFGLFYDLLSCSYLQHCVIECDNGSYYCRQLVCSELRTVQCATNRPSRRCNSRGWAQTADRPRPSWNLRHTDDDLAGLSMDVRDCIRYRNKLKHLIHLRSSSKRVTVRFATWNPANWHENQIEIQSKILLIPQTLRTRAELVAS